MERNDVWYKDNNIEVDLMGIDFYLKTGDVDLEEVGFDEESNSSFTKELRRVYTHLLWYAKGELIEKLRIR